MRIFFAVTTWTLRWLLLLLQDASARRHRTGTGWTFSWKTLSIDQAANTAFPSHCKEHKSQSKHNRGRIRRDEGVVDANVMQSSGSLGCFNHDLVGITNPILTILSPSSSRITNIDAIAEQDSSIISHVDRPGSSYSHSNRSTGGLKRQLQSLADSLLSNKSDDPYDVGNTGNHANEAQIIETKSGWRIYRYRKVIGQGEECYNAVRDAALGWESMHRNSKWAGVKLFQYQTTHARRGVDNNVSLEQNDIGVGGQVRLLQRHISSFTPEFLQQQLHRKKQYRQRKTYVEQVESDKISYSEKAIYEERDPLRSALLSDRVLQITNSPGVKRLVTFARVNMMRGKLNLPIWVVNPCMIVYELVDERCNNGQNTYSATAYATLRGHLLKGEERVIVSMSDQSKNVCVDILSYSHSTPGILGNIVFAACKEMQIRFFGEEMDTLEKIAKDSMKMKPMSPIGSCSTYALPATTSFQLDSYNASNHSRYGYENTCLVGIDFSNNVSIRR